VTSASRRSVRWQQTENPPVDRLAVFVGESGMATEFKICHDGATWEHDFDLTYTKVA
jgi:hypothetical protein